MNAEKTHAKLGASTSEIWLNCPGAPNLWEKAPPEKESPYAQEGTRAHKLLELWAKGYRDNHSMRPSRETLAKYPMPMVSAVTTAIQDLRNSWTPYSKKELVIEKKVSLSEILDEPEMYGTVDLGIIHHFGTLEAIDYKHGSGVRVEVVKENAWGGRNLNTQLVYYALGLAAEYDFNFSDVVLKIIQPRYSGASPISQIKISIGELHSYIDLFKKGIARTKDKRARRFAGPWCRFCKAKSICEEGKGQYRNDCRNDFN